MMGQTHQSNIQPLYPEITDSRIADMFDTLDELHSAVSEGRLASMTTMSKRELLCWLRDLAYTAQETITELEAVTIQESVLRLVK